MTTTNILKGIQEEIDRLQQAKGLIEGASMKKTAGKTPHSGRYRLTAAARERISQAQKARWAKHNQQKEAAIQKRVKAAKSRTPKSSLPNTKSP